jgi:hypothetical protein
MKKKLVIISTGFEPQTFMAQRLASPPKAANLLANLTLYQQGT